MNQLLAFTWHFDGMYFHRLSERREKKREKQFIFFHLSVCWNHKFSVNMAKLSKTDFRRGRESSKFNIEGESEIILALLCTKSTQDLSELNSCLKFCITFASPWYYFWITFGSPWISLNLFVSILNLFELNHFWIYLNHIWSIWIIFDLFKSLFESIWISFTIFESILNGNPFNII